MLLVLPFDITQWRLAFSGASANEAPSEQTSLYAWCRSGSSYIQGDLGAVKVSSTGDGGVYLGASSQYPGSISSVDVDMSGNGNTVVATSNGELIWLSSGLQ